MHTTSKTLAELVAEITAHGRPFGDCEWFGQGGGGRYTRDRETREVKAGVVNGVRLAEYGCGIIDCRVAPAVPLAEFVAALEAAGCRFNDSPATPR